MLDQRLGSVQIQSIQGNPNQPDVSFRGFTASPVLGTPQGLSVYMDGVRMNQPFGDVVSWDLIPKVAIDSMTLMPGSNPLFGLNTLGGSLSLRTKDGIDWPGSAVQLSVGSYGRRALELEHGFAHPQGLDGYFAANLSHDDGWRDTSPSDVRQLFGKLGWQDARTRVTASLAYADNELWGNSVQEQQLLQSNWSSVYTTPDITNNRSTLLTLTGRHELDAANTLSGNLYWRNIRTGTINGDVNGDSLDQALYQPNAAERAALAAAGYTGFPTSGENASNTPFPFWRCLANVLLQDEPAEKCNGLINRGSTDQSQWGGSALLARRMQLAGYPNQLSAGLAYDASRVSYQQSTQLGFLNPDRSVTGLPAFADGVTGGTIDGEPFDNRVDLLGRTSTASIYASDTLTTGQLALDGRRPLQPHARAQHRPDHAGRRSVVAHRGPHVRTVQPGARRHLCAGRRVDGVWRLQRRHPRTQHHRAGLRQPGPALPPAQRDGRRSAPAPGGDAHLGVRPARALVDAIRVERFGVPRGQRRRHPVHRGAADPASATSRTSAAPGARAWSWGSTAGWTGSRSARTSRSCRPPTAARRPFPAPPTAATAPPPRARRAWTGPSTCGRGIASRWCRHVSSGSTRTGRPRAAGRSVRPCLRRPAPMRAATRTTATSRMACSSSAPGRSAGYAVLNLSARYRPTPRIQWFAHVDNVFDRRYSNAALLGETAFDAQGRFVARPFPAVDGEFPLRNSTFFAPGAPRTFLVGLRYTIE